MENKGFIIGTWYKCSCNKNYYRFDGYLEDEKFGHNAVINPLSSTHGYAKPGYTERMSHNSCIEYFSPDNIADLSEIQPFLPLNNIDYDTF